MFTQITKSVLQTYRATRLKMCPVILTVACCAALGHCFGPEVRVVATRNNQTAHIGIGFIENRDVRLSPFSTRDFADMLEFEFLKHGYAIEDLDLSALNKSRETKTEENSGDATKNPEAAPGEGTRETEKKPEPISDESANPPTNDASTGRAEIEEAEQTTYADIWPETATGQSSTPAGETTKTPDRESDTVVPYRIYNDTYHLLPDRLRSIAGELQPPDAIETGEERQLTMREIRDLSAHNKFDYYIQGAISRTESGLLLDLEESTFVFLEIFDARGERVGAINLSIDDATLKKASFLQTVSEQIATAFHRQIHAHTGNSAP